MYNYITNIYLVQHSLKQQNEVNDRKGWGVIRSEVRKEAMIDRFEKKLNQIIVEMKQEMVRQKQEMEVQRKSEIEEIKGVLQEMQRCAANNNNVNHNTV